MYGVELFQKVAPLTLILLSFIYRSGGEFLYDIHNDLLAEEEADTGFCPISSSTSSLNPSCGQRTSTVSSFSNPIVNMASKEHRERTFIMVKPDGVQRGLVGEIIKRFEQKGFKLVAIKFQMASEELLKKHYAAHTEQPFFPGLVKYIASGPVVPMVWEGVDVIKTARQMLGATNPSNSAPGTIRGDFCIQTGRNAIHGSDSIDSANTEIALWFKDEELVTWSSNAEPWLYE